MLWSLLLCCSAAFSELLIHLLLAAQGLRVLNLIDGTPQASMAELRDMGFHLAVQPVAGKCLGH